MLDDRMRDVLFSDATLRLGEVHGAILKAAHAMDQARFSQVKKEFGWTTEWTEFGVHVGQDEIHWWIFENETNVDELLAMTGEALNAAQVLKTDSAKLKSRETESYEVLLLSLREFADKHQAEIDALHKYVGLLEKRHAMAPCMLFTYRVWGSTRMADRDMKWVGEETGGWEKETRRALAEIALGVRERGRFVYWDTYHEVGFEIFESMDPETTPPDTEIIPPERTVVRRTSHAVYGKCADYFLEIRDSLRNIKIDIEKFKEQRELYESDEFWRTFITKTSKVKTTEPQMWDFKETLNIWHVKDEPARREAKRTFAEDVASFANTTGGVLIIGVTDQREIVGIGDGKNLENRLKVARDVLTEYLEYEREIVTFRQIAMGEQRDKICLIILVSQACSSVGASDGEGRFSYPVRHETGIKLVASTDTPASKSHRKSDNRDFLTALRQFIRDN
ncbi:MAG: ATP-binding protein [Candidatus Sulfotelmatobacter sp.]